MKGLIMRSTGKWSVVRLEDGRIVDCQIKGKLRIEGIRTTNPVAVGDEVEVELIEDWADTRTGVIKKVHPRRNYIIRKSVNLSKEAHIVASNIDKAFLIITIVRPKTATGFIDRFLVTAEAYGVKATLIFNKVDIYRDEEMAKVNELIEIYSKIGYDCLKTSAKDGTHMEELKEMMKDKVSMFSGMSGAGKSSIINAIQPGLQLKTSVISDYHNKGKHTTTFAEMHELDFGAYVIDTPGIKGFGLVDIEKEDLNHYFPEMFALLEKCKFHNCQHINEPKCAVKDALDQGEIAEHRYINYRMMYDDDGNVYRSAT